jgi:hypothetical protein
MKAQVERDAEFFFKHTNEEGYLWNLFWADSQSQIDYEAFGDWLFLTAHIRWTATISFLFHLLGWTIIAVLLLLFSFLHSCDFTVEWPASIFWLRFGTSFQFASITGAFILVLHHHRKFTDIKLIFLQSSQLRDQLTLTYQSIGKTETPLSWPLQLNRAMRSIWICGLILPESTPGDFLEALWFSSALNF